MPVIVPDHQRPQWTHGELSGIANAPGTPEEVRRLIEAHTARFFELLAAQRAARAAETAVVTAEAVDTQNRAVALARGNLAPKAQTPDAVKARDQALRHEADLVRAVRIVEDDLRANIAAHSDSWVGVVDDEEARLRADAAKLIDEVAAAFLRLAQLARVRAQIVDPYAPKVWSAFDMSAAGVHVHEHITGAVDTLRGYARPPAAPGVLYLSTGLGD